MTARLIFFVLGVALANSGCAHSWMSQSDRPTCIVLSAGGPAGIAHIGALRAAKAHRVPIDCVTGTSMGALVGGLYASAPQEPVQLRYQALLQQYSGQTERDIARNALLGGLAGAVIAGVVTGGAGMAPMAMAASAGAMAAANATPRVNLKRFSAVLHRFHEGDTIEGLPVAFAVFYHQRRDLGLELVVARSGLVAQAVSRSIANPFIFSDFDPVSAGYVDPGSDRMAAVPVEETCRLFPRARLLAINASGRELVHSARMKCPLLQVRIDVGQAGQDALLPSGSEFERVVEAGYAATEAALKQAGAQ